LYRAQILSKLNSVYTQSYLYHTQLSTADPGLYVSVLRYYQYIESRYKLGNACNVISNFT